MLWVFFCFLLLLVFQAVCSQLPLLSNWHDSLLALRRSSLQPKWRLSVPVADEVNYLRTMLIRWCRLILEWFIPRWKETLFYVPLYLVLVPGSERRTGPGPAQSPGSACAPPTMDKPGLRLGRLSDIPDVWSRVCVLIMKEVFQPPLSRPLTEIPLKGKLNHQRQLDLQESPDLTSTHVFIMRPVTDGGQ